MMEQGKQQLLDAILQEARQQAEQILADSDATVLRLQQQAQQQADDYLAERAAQDARDVDDLLAKRKVSAEMEAKKAYLAAKREVLALILRRLVEKLTSLPHDEYLRLVQSLLERYAQQGDLVLIAKDCAVTYGDVQSLPVCRRLMLKVDYGPQVTSGVMLCGDKMDKDLSFEAVAQSVFADCEMQLAQQLFGAMQ